MLTQRIAKIFSLVLVALLCGACATGKMNESRLYGPPVLPEAPRHPVTVRLPDTVGALDTDVHDIRGTPVGISCQTCHAQDGLATLNDAPKDFHAKMKLVHGDNTCYSCHDQKDRTKLHLANGTQLNFDESQKLCAQCHGVQYRDYSNGSHGGMTGYWDLQRGPRERNSCLTCHSAHTPKYAKVRPVHPPKDRFLEWKRTHEEPQGDKK